MRGRCSMMCKPTQCLSFHPGHNLQPSSYSLACTMYTMLISPEQLLVSENSSSVLILALCVCCLFVDNDLLFIPGKIKKLQVQSFVDKTKEKKEKDTALGKFIHPCLVFRSSLFLTFFLPSVYTSAHEPCLNQFITNRDTKKSKKKQEKGENTQPQTSLYPWYIDASFLSFFQIHAILVGQIVKKEKKKVYRLYEKCVVEKDRGFAS